MFSRRDIALSTQSGSIRNCSLIDVWAWRPPQRLPPHWELPKPLRPVVKSAGLFQFRKLMRPMTRYRLFLFEGSRVVETREFPATDDVVAELLVRGWRNRRRAELWCGDRQVRRWRLKTEASDIA